MTSMTGFGRFQGQIEEWNLEVSIRSVNSRFSDIRIHIPRIYDPLEIEIRKKITQKIKRGSVDLFINRKSLSSSDCSVYINEALAEKWLKSFSSVGKKLGLEPVRSAQILFQIPEFISVEQKHLPTRKEAKALFRAIDSALSDCLQVRQKEGSLIKKNLKKCLQGLLKQVSHIKKLRGRVVDDLSKKYRERLKKLGFPSLNLSSKDMEPALAREIVILLDKSDINEEIQRLSIHIKAALRILSAPGSQGKKLDFYAQELLREINTIGSKSADSELSQIVIESKTLIEKYREQVQNLE